MQIIVALEREKETKNKVRFQEAGDTESLGTVYVPKETLKRLGNPAELELTIAAAASRPALAAL